MSPDLPDLHGHLKAPLVERIGTWMATPATRESYEFSITVRPGENDGMDRYKERFISYMDEQCTHYAIATEQKGDKSTEHFQVACIVKVPKRADNVKKSLIQLLGSDWNTNQKLSAVCVKKNREGNDIKLLAGGYCQKQDTSVLLKGWTTEELEPYISEYEQLLSKAQMRNISSDNIVKILKQFHDEISDNKDPVVRDNFSLLSHHKRITTVFQYAIANGANLYRYSSTQYVLYFVNNYDVLFGGKTASDMLRILSQPRV